MATEIYEVVISGILGGQFVQTVQHVKAEIATPVNPFASAILIAQDINANGILEAFCACLPTDYKATSIRCRRVSGAGGTTAVITGGGLDFTDGARAGNISSAQVCPLIIWVPTTDIDSPGKLFLPGVSEDDIDDMVLTASLIADIQAFINEWIAGGTLGGVDSYVGCIFRRVGGTGDVIFAGQVSPLIGTQRRRLRPV